MESRERRNVVSWAGTGWGRAAAGGPRAGGSGWGSAGALTEGGAAARVVLVQVMFQCVPAATDAHHHMAPQHLRTALVTLPVPPPRTWPKKPTPLLGGEVEAGELHMLATNSRPPARSPMLGSKFSLGSTPPQGPSGCVPTVARSRGRRRVGGGPGVVGGGDGVRDAAVALTRTKMRVLESPTLYLPSETLTMGNCEGQEQQPRISRTYRQRGERLGGGGRVGAQTPIYRAGPYR